MPLLSKDCGTFPLLVVDFFFVTLLVDGCFSKLVVVGFGIGAFGRVEVAAGRLCIGEDVDPPGVVGGVGVYRV